MDTRLVYGAMAAGALLLLGVWGFTDTPDPDAAKPFAFGELSFGNEFALTFTPDGNAAYVTRRTVDADDQRKVDIYYAHFWNDTWSELARSNISSDFRDADQFISPDGKSMYFMSERPIPGTTEKHDYDLWVAHKSPIGWQTPEHMGPVVNSSPAWEGFPVVSADGTLFFFSNRDGGLGEADIYMSDLTDGLYGEPQNLGSPINSEAWDGLAYVTPDKSLMIFYSDRPGGFGKGDLYVSHFRSGQWSQPENLGAKVNTPADELFPHIGPDKETLFFTRYGENGERRLYSIPLDHLAITTK